MTTFKLLEMIEAKASIIDERMVEAMLVISIACWFSVTTSSSNSWSSSYWANIWLRCRRSSISSLDRSAVVK